jgi:type 1 glutamine amidotransferase
MRKIFLLVVIGIAAGVSARDYIVAPKIGKGIEPPTKEWVEKIKSLAPSEATVVPAKSRRVLVFSLATGFKHKVAPHVVEVMKVLGDQTATFEVVVSDDVEMFTSKKLKGFDAVVLNNVCPHPSKRDLFFDALKDEKRAAKLEANLESYVKEGGGLVVIHGAIAFQNNSMAVSEMIGGSFDFHPKSQIVTLDLVDPRHPLVAGFEGKGFIHQDEPYLFKNAYKEMNFRPLLVMDVSKLNEETRNKPVVNDEIR